MRGVYTAGVLDYFMDEGLDFPLVSTSSSGAVIASSYVANQRDRNYRILDAIVRNREFISWKRLLQGKALFDMDFIFDEVPNRVVPLDFQAFSESDTKLVIATTELRTGKPVYFDAYANKDELLTVIRASSSLPVFASPVAYREMVLLDGGVSDPIPVQPALDHGFQKIVVVLTRNRGYVKKPTRLNWLYRRVFKDYPEMQRTLNARHLVYNRTMQKIREMEERNQVFIIQPKQPLTVTRFEKRTGMLRQLYRQAYREAESVKDELLRFIEQPPAETWG